MDFQRLNLGSGPAKTVPREFRVDQNPHHRPDLVANIFDTRFWARLPREKWRVIRCLNVVNYAPTYTALQEFFHEVHQHLDESGNATLELEFMNIANRFKEPNTLALHLLVVRVMLWNAGFNECSILTPRHWIVPTGNVSLYAFKTL